ncbi:general substrate transporter, partial [Xylogone sp. PMI_703]
PKYVYTAILTAFGGAIMGLDTGSIGPLTAMPQFTASFGLLKPAVHGIIVSSILLSAASASFFAGNLADRVGRVRGIAIGSFSFGLGAALEAGSTDLAMLVVGRLITGVGQGLFFSDLVVYNTEISPPAVRGTMASLPQFLTTVGICAGYFICYGSVNSNTSFAWRFPFAFQASMAVTFAVLAIVFLPESPRWLTATGRPERAERVWNELGVLAAEREKASNSKQQPLPTSPIEAQPKSSLLDVFGKDVWRRTLLGVFLLGMQQLSGIDGVLYYAPQLFRQAGLSSSEASFLASGVSALLMFIVTIPAFLFADRWGRRTSTIFGGVVMACCMLTMGILYATNSVHGNDGAARWLVVVLIYVFSLTFCGTWAVGMKVYVGEIQPPKTRAGATSLAHSSCWVTNWVVAFTTPIFLARSTFGVYFFFGASLILTVWVCLFAMPETKGRSLEDIDSSFDK